MILKACAAKKVDIKLTFFPAGCTVIRAKNLTVVRAPGRVPGRGPGRPTNTATVEATNGTIIARVADTGAAVTAAVVRCAEADIVAATEVVIAATSGADTVATTAPISVVAVVAATAADAEITEVTTAGVETTALAATEGLIDATVTKIARMVTTARGEFTHDAVRVLRTKSKLSSLFQAPQPVIFPLTIARFKVKIAFEVSLALCCELRRPARYGETGAQ